MIGPARDRCRAWRFRRRADLRRAADHRPRRSARARLRAEAERRRHRGAAAREDDRAAGVNVIFTDLQAGSCTMASRRILRGMDDAVLIAGANLPTLLDFVFAEGKSASDAARHAAERGRAAISVHGAGA